MNKEQINNAIEKAIPKPPRVHELGGGIYYTCYWMICNESIHRWQRYCPMCGQRILWEDDDAQGF